MALYFTTGDAQKNVDKIKAVFQLDLIPKKGQPPVRRWAIDMKNGQGSVKYGVAEKSDVQFTMTEDDFIAIQDGKLNPQTAFMTGKMKIKGSMAKATLFTPEIFPKPTPENLEKYKA